MTTTASKTLHGGTTRSDNHSPNERANETLVGPGLRPYRLRTVVGYALYAAAFLAGMHSVEIHRCVAAPCGFLLPSFLVGYGGFVAVVLGAFMTMTSYRQMNWGSWVAAWFGSSICGGMVAIAHAAHLAL